jgi:putative transposase
MPWKECHVVDERLRFIARLLEGEPMTALCGEFGISRKTGYKIYDRYKTCGLHGLTDQSRRSLRHANQLPLTVEKLIVGLKKKYPSWGAPKIREKLRPQCSPLRCPAISTAHAVLDRHGLVRKRRRRRPPLTGTPLSHASRPMPCGVRTTRANSCWPTSAIAIPSRSPTSPPAICSAVTRWKPPRRRGRGDLRARLS